MAFLQFRFKNKVEGNESNFNERLERQLIKLINKKEILKYLSSIIQNNERVVEDVDVDETANSNRNVV